jgi:hypothetical protein
MIDTALKPIDTPVFSYWAALYRSFYSKRLYVDVGKRWRGFGFLYLLLVVAIFIIPLSIRITTVLKQDFNQQIIEPLLQMPTLYVQNGEISIDKPVPYLVTNRQGQVTLIVDPSDTITQFSEKYPHLHILINKRTIAFRVPSLQLFYQTQPPPNGGKPIIQTLGPELNQVFDGKKFIESSTIPTTLWATQLMIYPLVTMALYSILFVIFPVMAFMGQIFSNVFFHFQISYKQACRLLIVSATPMILILLVCLFIDKVFSGMGAVLMGLLIAYYCFALYSLKSESRQVVNL